MIREEIGTGPISGDSETETPNPEPEQPPAGEQPPAEENPSAEEPSACTPNWQCTDWQPLVPENLACGETFKQTCASWVDTNNCGTEEGKPTETQEVTGTYCQTPKDGTAICQNNTCSISCNDGYQLDENNICQPME